MKKYNYFSIISVVILMSSILILTQNYKDPLWIGISLATCILIGIINFVLYKMKN